MRSGCSGRRRRARRPRDRGRCRKGPAKQKPTRTATQSCIQPCIQSCKVLLYPGGYLVSGLPVFQNFSHGQRQLFGVARALLKESSVVILDEATASCDAVTDALIQELVRRLFKHCTVITIAHRLNTIADSDRIMVMDSGAVAEYDTPANLLATEGSLWGKLIREGAAAI